MGFYVGPQKWWQNKALGSVVTDGLVLYFDAGNPNSYPGSGNIVNSLVSPTKTGTLNYVGYNSNNGGYFDLPFGSSHITVTKDSRIFNFSGDFTMSAWFMINGTPSSFWPSAIFSSWAADASSSDSSFIVYVTIGGYLVAELKGEAGGAIHQTLINLNTWYNVVLVRKNSIFTLYLNTVASPNTGTSSASIAPTIDTLLGTYSFSGPYNINGRISSFMVYNTRALSDSEILQNFNALKGRYGL